ncbi:hypothetical protein BC628DRAFT_1042676 [Trametes gibbosa]|nr:hypothetical protein BC628DRAFT_1042676 [Trametes gibbosa]
MRRHRRLPGQVSRRYDRGMLRLMNKQTDIPDGKTYQLIGEVGRQIFLNSAVVEPESAGYKPFEGSIQDNDTCRSR